MRDFGDGARVVAPRELYGRRFTRERAVQRLAGVAVAGSRADIARTLRLHRQHARTPADRAAVGGAWLPLLREYRAVGHKVTGRDDWPRDWRRRLPAGEPDNLAPLGLEHRLKRPTRDTSWKPSPGFTDPIRRPRPRDLGHRIGFAPRAGAVCARCGGEIRPLAPATVGDPQGGPPYWHHRCYRRTETT